MMIDDYTLKQLLRINDELLQLCKWLNEKRDTEISSRLIPSFGTDDVLPGWKQKARDDKIGTNSSLWRSEPVNKRRRGKTLLRGILFERLLHRRVIWGASTKIPIFACF